jgi:hypothetical protein
MMLTRRMGSFQYPICVLRVRNELALPLNLEMARCSLKEGWPGKVVDVKLGLRWHFEIEIGLNEEK